MTEGEWDRRNAELAETNNQLRQKVVQLTGRINRALLAATVGSLTPIGYQNALKQIKDALTGKHE